MKKSFYLLIVILLFYVMTNAEVLHLKNYVKPYEKNQIENGFYLPIVYLNENNQYIQLLKPIFDTLTTNDRAEIYIWQTSGADSENCSIFRDWEFKLLKRQVQANSCIGIYKHIYNEKSKFFALLEDELLKPEFNNKLYNISNDTLYVKYSNVNIPDNEYVLVEDIMTFVRCCMVDDSLCVIKFFYNLNL